jgi:hypothetical protein
MLEKLLFMCAGVLVFWALVFVEVLLRALLCGCWKMYADGGELELPRHWKVLGVSYWQCPRCKKRFVHWKTFCRLLEEAGE